ncbi:hypothetical protein ACWD4F_29280 [Streptomyces aureus]
MPLSPSTSAAVTPSGPAPPTQGHDGTSPFPPDGPAPARDGGERLYVTVTTAIVVLPFVAIARAFPALCVLTLVLPLAGVRAIGGTRPYGSAALPRAVLVRIALLRHVTWSVNSLCHLIGERPFRARRPGRATDLRHLALLAFGENRHDLHHADPTSARHGVDRGRLAPSAAVIRFLERLGRVHDLRRPTAARVAACRA